MVTLRCPAPDDTLALGEALGRAARPGLTLLLLGPLGAGKTLLTKGVARGLEVPGWRYVTSPTFAIHNQYRGRLVLHHLDLYRLGDSGELETAGLEEILYGHDVCVVEWPDSFLDELPADRLWVRITWDASGARVLRLHSEGIVADAVLVAARSDVRGAELREADS